MSGDDEFLVLHVVAHEKSLRYAPQHGNLTGFENDPGRNHF